MLAALFLMDAFGAAQLVVRTDRPCIVVVNLVPYPTSGGDITVDIPTGKEGEQNVRIRNLLGEQQWAGKVDLPPNTRRLLKWQLGHMNVDPVEPLRSGKPKLTDHGPGIQDGIRREAPGDRLRAAPAPEGVRLEVPEDPFLSAVEQATAEGGGGGAPAPAPATPSEAPATGGLGAVKLTNRTGSWANVRIDGELFEFRGELDRTLPLGTGAHRVEIGEFRDKEVWWTGELWVYPDFTVELQFSQAAAPVAINRDEAWRP